MKLRFTKLTLISALLFVFTAPVSAYQDKSQKENESFGKHIKDVNIIADAKENKVIGLPFTGKRWFDFFGSNGTGMTITIKSNGDTLIEAHGKFGSDIVYQGKFKNPMYDVYGDGYSIKGNQIYMLKNGKVANDCMREGTPCISELLE